MQLSFLAGGTGTPKLLQGFREITEDEQLGIICNSGDDINWYGLRVCPDLDTILYLFSNRLDTDKFWGVKEESFSALDSLKSLSGEEWFSIGDKDLGLHLFRTQQLEKMRFTEVVKNISSKWGIRSTIVPMSDKMVQTIIYTNMGKLGFQEYFVKMKTDVDVIRVEYEGDKCSAPNEVLSLLTKNPLIIGPSNPITSIGPILSMEKINETLKRRKSKNLAISPIQGTKAFSGPTVKLMHASGFDASVKGLAEYYKDIIGTIILDPKDSNFRKEFEKYDIETVFLPIKLSNIKQKMELAKEILNIV